MNIYDEKLSRKQEQVAATPDMQSQRKAVLDRLALLPGEHVLEVGSGNGRFVEEMSAVVGANGRVVGIDAAPAMIPLAQTTFPDSQFLLADATSLPFEDASFDAITSAQVLSYVEDIETGLAELFRVLKPGGRIVVLDTDWHSIEWRHPDPALMKRAITLAISVYPDAWLTDTLAEKLTNAGLQGVEANKHPIANSIFAPEKYSYQFADFVEPAMRKSAKFTEIEADNWIGGLRELSAAGQYEFIVNRMIFSAYKQG